MYNKLMKVILIFVFILLSNFFTKQVYAFDCWKVITQLNMDKSIIQLIDIDCDDLVDVIQEIKYKDKKFYRSNWWYIYKNKGKKDDE